MIHTGCLLVQQNDNLLFFIVSIVEIELDVFKFYVFSLNLKKSEILENANFERNQNVFKVAEIWYGILIYRI